MPGVPMVIGEKKEHGLAAGKIAHVVGEQFYVNGPVLSEQELDGSIRDLFLDYELARFESKIMQ